jgi:hypothetical protein
MIKPLEDNKETQISKQRPQVKNLRQEFSPDAFSVFKMNMIKNLKGHSKTHLKLEK